MSSANSNFKTPMSDAAYGNQKKNKNIRYWKEAYGIHIKNDRQYLFFKANRSLIIKALPILQEMNELCFESMLERNEDIVLE